jgi:hypothetical protein
MRLRVVQVKFAFIVDCQVTVGVISHRLFDWLALRVEVIIKVFDLLRVVAMLVYSVQLSFIVNAIVIFSSFVGGSGLFDASSLDVRGLVARLLELFF